MLINGLNWCFILLAGYLLGYAFSESAGAALGHKIKSPDGCFMAGTVLLITYSQFFSLFAGVGIAADLLLILACLLILIRFRTGLSARLKDAFYSLRGISAPKLLAGAFILLFFLKVSAFQPTAYDDYLYHAQALQWTERYGLVKGLANLHNRFAYNSAFLCLQALFSLRGFTGRSLHTVNGLYGCVLSLYCLFSLKLSQRPLFGKGFLPGTSDFLKLALLFYAALNMDAMTGLDTDPLAMLCLCYVFIKWSELLEAGVSDPVPYGFLSLLSACTLCLKLSCGPLVLFTLLPLVCLIRRKKWGTLLSFAGLDLAIVLPFLIRNVLISGYLVYPVTFTALPVDWRFPKSSLQGDKEGIQLFGRGLNTLFDERDWDELVRLSFREWLPIWFRNLAPAYRLVFLLTAVSCVFLAACALRALIKKKPDPRLVPCGVSVCCFLFWLSSSPLIRDGGVLMFLVLAECFGMMYNPVRRLAAVFSLLLHHLQLAVLLLQHGLHSVRMLVIPEDYRVESEENMGAETAPVPDPKGSPVTIWYRIDGEDQTDYAHFPSVPDHDAIVSMGYRGDTIADGFYFIPEE